MRPQLGEALSVGTELERIGRMKAAGHEGAPDSEHTGTVLLQCTCRTTAADPTPRSIRRS